MNIEPEGIPAVIEHNGWVIYGWTGWKGTKHILGNGIVAAEAPLCLICNQRMVDGQAIQLKQGYRPLHWICAHPDNPPDRIMGQWLAAKGEGPDARFMEVNVDNLVAAFINGREYKRGESFPVSIEGAFITEHTPDAAREAARQIGLQRLKDLIDQIEAREVESE